MPKPPFLLTTAQMRRLSPHFPRSRGIPRVDARRVLSGIIYVIRHGLQWRGAPLPPGFTLRRDGLFWQPDDPEKPPVHVCGRLLAEARTHDGNGRAWGVLLTWLDRDGREHRWAMPLAMLAGDGTAVREHLLDGGLFVASVSRARTASGVPRAGRGAAHGARGAAHRLARHGRGPRLRAAGRAARRNRQ